MLGDRGIISQKDARDIVRGLKAIDRDIAARKMAWDTGLEDVHTNIEAALVARVGEAGKRLHTGRSRNDQIATDMRLWMRDQIDAITGLLAQLRAALLDLAEAHQDVIPPGLPTSSPPSPSSWRTTSSPTWKCSRATAIASPSSAPG